MNKQKPARKRVCECGKKFKVTVKFGNETRCNACYKAHSAEFDAWFASLSDEEQKQTLAAMREYVAELEQALIDGIAASLLADVEINL